ncbi:MAG: endonuclease/exonuclease/phosphatase family protein [Paracoccaceae bacterium]
MPPSSLRLASYNVEWMNALFNDAGQMLADYQLSARHQITRAEQLAALGAVFTALDADGILIVEAPDQSAHRSTTRALETFAAHFHLRAIKAVIGFASDTEQEIAFLYDPTRLTVTHDPRGAPATTNGATGAPRFDTALRHDINDDGVDELVIFSKPPLELAVQTASKTLHLIGVHAKSKAPHGRVSPAEFKRISIDNRRKQLAECHWLRARAETHLAAGDNLIVMGDFNDGPGIDEYEQTFGQSGIEVVLGLTAPPAMRLTDPHAMMALSSRISLQPTSARFWLAPAKCYFEALLDFIMVSPNLAAQNPVWRIWHPFNDPQIPPDLSKAILTASDHFPVTIDF